MATSVLGLKTFAASDPVDVNEVNDNYVKIDNGVKTAMQGRAAHNLLDNSDFRNPVNQRRITETSLNGYFIDRWGIYDGTSKVISSGIQVNANRGNATFLYQYIKALRDGIYTFAAKVNGNIVLRVIQISGTTATTIDGNKAGYTGGYLVVIYANDDKFEFNFRVESGSTITVAWAALYEGSYTADTLPAYVPKDNELETCRFYARPFIKTAPAVAIAATAIRAEMVLDPPMRIAPTITIDSVGDAYTPDGKKSVSGSYADTNTADRVGYVFYTNSVTTGVPCVITGIKGFLSADL